MEIENLRKKLLWQMTGEELIYLIENGVRSDLIIKEIHLNQKKKQEVKYVYGLKGIAKLFGCSVSSAMRLKRSGKINNALIQEGRKIIVDVDKALLLVRSNKNNNE